MAGLFVDIFKVFFLWDTSRTQRNRFKSYAFEVMIVGALAFIFSAISVGSTALYLMPYTANMIEGALYAMGKSLQDAGIFDKMVEYSLGFSIGFALILEIGTIATASKFITIRKKIKSSIIPREEDVADFKLWGILTAFLVSIQVATAFGGLLNTYKMIEVSEADRVLLKGKKKDLDSIISTIALLNDKVNKVESGELKLTKEDLTIREDNRASIFSKMLVDVQMELKKAREEHKRYASKIKDIYYPKHFYTKAEQLIKRHSEDNIKPLELREQELLNKIDSLKNIKTKLTKSEWIERKRDDIKKLQLEREKKHQEVKDYEAQLQDKVGDINEMALIFFLMALTLITVQSLIANRLETIKDTYSTYVDGLSGRVGNSTKRVEKIEKLEASKRVKREPNKEKEVKRDENGFEYEKTAQLLEFWKSYYKENSELPSIAKSAGKSGLKEHEVKKARAELKQFGYYKDFNTQIVPTEKFLKLFEKKIDEETLDTHPDSGT